MSLLSVAPLGVVVHGLHHALLLGGAAAVPVLAAAPWYAARRERALDEEERRIAALRRAASQGALASRASALGPTLLAAPGPARSYAGDRPTLLLVAAVASTAAASVHGAATVTHLSRGVLVAGFFLLSAVVQLGWAVLAVSGTGRRLWAVGAAVNGALALLWVTTRTTGLPLGLAPTEAVGAWDVAATAWELVVVSCCLALLLKGGPARSMEHRWSAAATVWLVVCVVVLVALAVSGGPA